MIKYLIVRKGKILFIDITNFSKRKLKNLILKDVGQVNRIIQGYYKNPKISIQKKYKRLRNRQTFGK